MQVIYQRHQFIVYKYYDNFIIHNQDKPFDEGHTHVEKFEMCRVIIDNVLKSRVPKTNNTYLLISHVKLTNDEGYKKLILDIHDNIVDDMLKDSKKKPNSVHLNHKV